MKSDRADPFLFEKTKQSKRKPQKPPQRKKNKIP